MTGRFVLLRHEVPESFGRPSHWDLLLEREQSCWTWAIEQLPHRFSGESNKEAVVALRLPNHRKHYLEYEGSVSGDRGTVARVFWGTCEWLDTTDQRITVDLRTEHQIFRLMLEAESEDRWMLRCE